MPYPSCAEMSIEPLDEPQFNPFSNTTLIEQYEHVCVFVLWYLDSVGLFRHTGTASAIAEHLLKPNSGYENS